MRRFMLAALIGCGLCCTQSVLAVVVEPTSITLEAIAGETAHQELRYENDTNYTQTYSVSVMGVDFNNSADNIVFEILPDSQQSWVELSETVFALEPGQERALNIATTIPKSTASHEFIFAVVATEQQVATSGVGAATGLASVFFVNINHGGRPELRIETFEPVPLSDRVLPIRFAALVSNVGFGFSQPQVAMVIKNVWGKQLDIVDLNPTGRRVPTGTNRIYSGEWLGSPWRFGVYTVELYVFPDETEAVTRASTSVVLFSWRTFSILGVSGLITGAFIYALLGARRR